MEPLELNKFNCQKCCSSGTLTTYKYVKELSKITNYTCQTCGHDNTHYVNNDDVNSYMWGYPKKWC